MPEQAVVGRFGDCVKHPVWKRLPSKMIELPVYELVECKYCRLVQNRTDVDDEFVRQVSSPLPVPL